MPARARTRLLAAASVLSGRNITRLAPLLVLVACGQPADCATLDGLERDACFDARVRAATGPDTVIAEARSIHDPLVRDAAVVAWVRAHRAELRPSDGRVCSVLTSTEQAGCARRLASPHLSR